MFKSSVIKSEYQYISHRLKQLMNLRQCNVRQLKEASGVSAPSIYKVRQCTFPPVSKSTIKMLEEALGATLIKNKNTEQKIKLSSGECAERMQLIRHLPPQQQIRLLLLSFVNQKLLASELGIAEITLSKVYSTKLAPSTPVAEKIKSLALQSVNSIDNELYELFKQTLDPNDNKQNRVKDIEATLIEETFLLLHSRYKYPLDGLHRGKRFNVPSLQSESKNNSYPYRVDTDIAFIENNQLSLMVDIWCIDSRKVSKLPSEEILTKIGKLAALNANILVVVTLTESIVLTMGQDGLERLDDIPVYNETV
jgi:transcriptional regulator with XRE-family HTH domain